MQEGKIDPATKTATFFVKKVYGVQGKFEPIKWLRSLKEKDLNRLHKYVEESELEFEPVLYVIAASICDKMNIKYTEDETLKYLEVFNQMILFVCLEKLDILKIRLFEYGITEGTNAVQFDVNLKHPLAQEQIIDKLRNRKL